jgi:hypothetical protein
MGEGGNQVTYMMADGCRSDSGGWHAPPSCIMECPDVCPVPRCTASVGHSVSPAQGSSGVCGTFGSPCLASREDFKVLLLEVWQVIN